MSSREPNSDDRNAPWSLTGYIRRMAEVQHELDKRLDKIENRINFAIGAIAVLGVTGIFNLITNILQSSGGTQ